MQHVLRFEHSGVIRWELLNNGGVTPIPGDFATTGSFVQQVDLEGLLEVAIAKATRRFTLAETEATIF